MAIASGLQLQKLVQLGAVASFSFAGAPEEVAPAPDQFAGRIIHDASTERRQLPVSVTGGAILDVEVAPDELGSRVISVTPIEEGQPPGSIVKSSVIEDPPAPAEPAQDRIIHYETGWHEPESFLRGSIVDIPPTVEGGVGVSFTDVHHKEQRVVPQSILRAPLIVEAAAPEDPRSERVIAPAEPAVAPESFVRGSLLEEIPVSDRIVHVAETRLAPDSVTIQPVIAPPVAEEPGPSRIISEAEPTRPVESFTRGSLTDEVPPHPGLVSVPESAEAVESVLVQAVAEEIVVEEPASIPSIVRAQPLPGVSPAVLRQPPVEEPSAPGLDTQIGRIVVDAEREREAVQSVTAGGLRDDFVDQPSAGLDLAGGTHTLEQPQSTLRHALIVDPVAPQDPPEGKHLNVRAEPIADAQSFERSGFVPPDVAVENPSAGLDIGSAHHKELRVVPVSVLRPSITPTPERSVRYIQVIPHDDWRNHPKFVPASFLLESNTRPDPTKDDDPIIVKPDDEIIVVPAEDPLCGETVADVITVAADTESIIVPAENPACGETEPDLITVAADDETVTVEGPEDATIFVADDEEQI